MKFADICLLFCLVSLSASAAHARELDFLQVDPRFTGGEFNARDPAHPNFWFYDQYAPARAALEADGVKLVGVRSLTLADMTADSDAFYMPPPTDPSAKAYPLTDREIFVVREYVAGGRSVIFNLGDAASAAMDNDLMRRLELSANQAAANVTGSTTYPIPSHPVFTGPTGTVVSFGIVRTGYFSSLGAMHGLINVGGKSVVAYVEKGDLTPRSGAYIFILDEHFLTDWTAHSASQQTFFLNLANYAVQDQYLHFRVKNLPATRP
jgi:hypothetical protein